MDDGIFDLIFVGDRMRWRSCMWLVEALWLVFSVGFEFPFLFGFYLFI